MDGGSASDILAGGEGNDSLNEGGSGIDTPSAAAGTTRSSRWSAANSIDGGTGNERCDARSYAGDYLVDLVSGISNFGGEDVAGVENVFAGDGNDTLGHTRPPPDKVPPPPRPEPGRSARSARILNGDNGGNSIDGGVTAEMLEGADGNDMLIGGPPPIRSTGRRQ